MRYLSRKLLNSLIDNNRDHQLVLRRVSRYSWETTNFNQGASFLFLLAQFLQPKIIIELGTFEAHGTMLLFAATRKNNSRIITIDCDQMITDRHPDHKIVDRTRRQKIKEANRQGGKITFISGDTRQVLKTILPKLPKVDFVFQDSMHFVLGLLEEFDLVRFYLSLSGVIVFDDWWIVKLKHWYLYSYLRNRFQKNISANPLKGPLDMAFNWFEVNRGKGFLIGQRVE